MAKRLGLTIDGRSGNLTDEALTCRSLGHKWAKKGQSRRRFLELLDKGHDEINRYCEHGCGSTWRILWDLHTGQVLENERVYPKNGEYLMPTGSGRMHRNDARVANWAREHPGYA